MVWLDIGIGWLESKSQIIINVDKDVEKLEPSHTAGRDDAAVLKNSLAFPPKIKHRVAI